MANIGGRPDYIFLPVIGDNSVYIGDGNRVVKFRMAGNGTAICFGNAAIFTHTYKILCLIPDQSYLPCTLLERINAPSLLHSSLSWQITEMGPSGRPLRTFDDCVICCPPFSINNNTEERREQTPAFLVYCFTKEKTGNSPSYFYHYLSHFLPHQYINYFCFAPILSVELCQKIQSSF